MRAADGDSRWNHNLVVHRALVSTIPPGARRGLDVGCGEGVSTRLLRTRVGEVLGIDPHEPSIELARSEGDDIEYVVGDVLTAPLDPGSFDVVTAVASLHHMDMRTGLERFAELVAPGGLLLVTGLAHLRITSPLDVAHSAVGFVLTRILSARHGPEWETSAPIVWPPPVTTAQARRIAREVLPGVRFRRHPLFRYTLRWQRPGDFA